jgi:cytochrome P450
MASGRALAFDPGDPEFIRDPYPLLARLREEDPVHWSEPLGAWIVTRYADARDATRDPRLSSDRLRPFFEAQPEGARRRLSALENNVSRWAVFVDPPSHTRLRALMAHAFTSRAVERLRASVAARIDELLAPLAGRDEFDLVGDFAWLLPAGVIADLLGVPREDIGRLKDWSDELSGFVFSGRHVQAKYERAARGVGEMAEYFARLIEAKRARPCEDLVSALVAATDGGERLSPEELEAMCVLLLFAGHETTTHLIGNGMHALLADPQAHAELAARRDDAAFVAGAIEELLRFDGPSLAQGRVAAEHLELGGKRIRRHERVFLMLAAANRDPLAFCEPDTLRLERTPNAHLTFGYGIHFCVGAPLARLEGQLALPRLLERFPRLALAGEPQWMDSLVIRGAQRMPLRVAH